MTDHGFFLTVDGPGAIGKSTTVAALTRVLRQAGHAVHATAEPSGSRLGEATRTLADEVRGEALALLVAADRNHHLDTEVRPQLAAGHVVVCDRYLPSSLVLQRLDGVPLEFVLSVNEGIDLPDLAVILTASAETIAGRLARRGSRHRFEDDAANTMRELELYRQAVPVLESRSVRVLTIDVGALTPVGVASAISHAAEIGSANVRTARPRNRLRMEP